MDRERLALSCGIVWKTLGSSAHIWGTARGAPALIFEECSASAVLISKLNVQRHKQLQSQRFFTVNCPGTLRFCCKDKHYRSQLCQISGGGKSCNGLWHCRDKVMWSSACPQNNSPIPSLPPPPAPANTLFRSKTDAGAGGQLSAFRLFPPLLLKSLETPDPELALETFQNDLGNMSKQREKKYSSLFQTVTERKSPKLGLCLPYRELIQKPPGPTQAKILYEFFATDPPKNQFHQQSYCSPGSEQD